MDLDLTRVPKIQWQIQGTSGESGEIWIDDIHLVGFDVPVGALCPGRISRNSANSTFQCVQSGNRVTVNYSLDRRQQVRIALFDLTGRLVKSVFNGTASAGLRSVRFESGEVAPAGNSYLMVLKTGTATKTQTLIINR